MHAACRQLTTRILTGLKTVLERLRPLLVTFRDEQGAELFDLPAAPRPGADAPAPVRLVAEFDNLILSHADRSRVISPENFKRLASRRTAATLTIELFGPAREREALEREAARTLVFCSPGASHDICFAPLAAG